MKPNKPNIKLRQFIKDNFLGLRNRAEITRHYNKENGTEYTRQWTSQLVKKLFTPEEIYELDNLIKEKKSRAINLK